jgi:hypothetical protein
MLCLRGKSAEVHGLTSPRGGYYRLWEVLPDFKLAAPLYSVPELCNHNQVGFLKTRRVFCCNIHHE